MRTVMMAVVVSKVTNVPGAKAYRVIQQSDDGDGDGADHDGDAGNDGEYMHVTPSPNGHHVHWGEGDDIPHAVCAIQCTTIDSISV